MLLLAAPLGVLLLILARERTVRIGQAQERLEAVRRERVRLQRAIQRIGEAFAPTLDFDDLLELTLQASAEAIDADGGRTSVLHAGRLGVIPHATVGAHETLPAALDAAEGQVLLNGQPAERREGDVTALAWPIGGHDNDPERRAGIVALARCGEPFNPFERSLLDYFVKQANVSVDNIDLRETLRLQAGTDSLTGLANRRRFEDVLAASVVHYDAARGWLHTIATNAARRSLRPSGEVAITGEEDWVATTTADGELLERSEREQVHEGLRRALGEHARFLRWRYVEDLSPTAIMELEGLSTLGQYDGRHRRALDALRGALVRLPLDDGCGTARVQLPRRPGALLDGRRAAAHVVAAHVVACVPCQAYQRRIRGALAAIRSRPRACGR